ncbi:hypothetical protein Ptr86124_001834 [Pyrenophora tritici-repentis]|uniref:Uncharacterized protein n=1 Tax=Pyrenophora tritici-repentis TaxID=45151 RepID=A0A922NMN5_9PLEO|nr:hypothetical protein Ptr86124_001834 [Pyrenophora tritici-repentis]
MVVAGGTQRQLEAWGVRLQADGKPGRASQANQSQDAQCLGVMHEDDKGEKTSGAIEAHQGDLTAMGRNKAEVRLRISDIVESDDVVVGGGAYVILRGGRSSAWQSR